LAGLDTGRSTRAQAHSTRPASHFSDVPLGAFNPIWGTLRTRRYRPSRSGDKTGDFRTSDAAAREEPSGPLGRRPGADVSWMSMNRIDQNPGRGVEADAGPEEPGQRDEGCSKPADLSDGQDPRRGSDHITMRPAITTASAMNPTRRPRQPSSSIRRTEAPSARPCQDCSTIAGAASGSLALRDGPYSGPGPKATCNISFGRIADHPAGKRKFTEFGRLLEDGQIGLACADDRRDAHCIKLVFYACSLELCPLRGRPVG